MHKTAPSAGLAEQLLAFPVALDTRHLLGSKTFFLSPTLPMQSYLLHQPWCNVDLLAHVCNAPSYTKPPLSSSDKLVDNVFNSSINANNISNNVNAVNNTTTNNGFILPPDLFRDFKSIHTSPSMPPPFR